MAVLDSLNVQPTLASMKPKSLFLLLLVTGFCASAQNQLSMVARCLSFQLQPSARAVSGYGTVTAYFTTYDGRNDILPLSTYTNGLYYYSGEVRPIGGGTYAVDYINYSSIYGYVSDGYLTCTPPATDNDSNGVPDFLQIENAVDVTFSAVDTTVYPSRASYAVSIRLIRGAGQVLGSYTYTYTTSGSSGSGTWSIVHVGGTGAYTRSAQNPIALSLASASFTGVVKTSTGNTTCTVNSQDQVSLEPFTITTSAGEQAPYPRMTFNRTGNRYLSSYTSPDGMGVTTWPDYTQWIVEVTDYNDSNANGVPDWSDTPNAPRLNVTYTPDSKTITLTGQQNHKYTTWHSTDLKTWSVVADLNIVTGTNKVSFNHGTTDGTGFYRATFP